LERTQTHLQKALQAIDALGADDHARLEQAVTFYRAFLDAEGDNPQLRPHVAHAWRRLGELQQHLDQPREAAAAYREATRHFTALTRQFPDRPEFVQRRRECQQRHDALVTAKTP
jgi:hypothetical protein